MVDSMLRRTDGKPVRYTGEQVVPSRLMQFGDIFHFKTASGNSLRRNLRQLEPAPVSFLERWRPDGPAVAEY